MLFFSLPFLPLSFSLLPIIGNWTLVSLHPSNEGGGYRWLTLEGLRFFVRFSSTFANFHVRERERRKKEISRSSHPISLSITSSRFNGREKRKLLLNTSSNMIFSFFLLLSCHLLKFFSFLFSIQSMKFDTRSGDFSERRRFYCRAIFSFFLFF